MKFYNRLLVVLVVPFVTLGFLRLLWWAAGAEWTEPALAAAFSMAFGILVSVVIFSTTAPRHGNPHIVRRKVR